ncbi:MAG: phosphoribosylformylglycinamidine synthase subunit PurL [Dehalococcoidia bacterium]|nr:phosphoribosylformylglycinamidine synthase subunit PurL [Dehalococcoidia bacterium]
MPISKETLDEIALSEVEYKAIVERLGREPNSLELGMFGSMWSEHCGYKHSKLLLRQLPSKSPRLLVMPGAENAGVVDIGDGLAVVMKVESHNHPSAVEPFQGAATGVGGIVRDIFAMGARPIALLNSLRFGPLDQAQNRSLFRGVVAGISWYGNCIGVPDVGGEVSFSTSYSGNPLINAMCVGLVEKGRMVRASASGLGNLLILVGADTGRDGIHGASGLASRTFEEEREMRPTVQVGNPFLEKVLIEGCLEALDTGYILAMQDLGAAGLTSTVVESVARSGSGAIINIERAPRREEGMTPYEMMLSESQERMLVVVSSQHEEAVTQVFDKWDLESTVIGEVTEDGLVRVYDGDSLEASLPVNVLTDPPLYRLQGVQPAYMGETQGLDLEALPIPIESAESILLRLLSFPDIAGKEWIYRQYDHQVQTNTLQAPGGDAAVLRVKGTGKGIAMSTDGNGRYCYLDPFVGGIIAVAEACRNLTCVGAEPLAITDCLNFGNPERPEVYYQLEQCIEGMTKACEALGVPVISGNVSLYNETRGDAIWPTPVVGSLGLLEDAEKRCTTAFKDEGDLVVLLGAAEVSDDARYLSGSAYLEEVHGEVAGIPSIDLVLEVRVQRLCRRAIEEGLLHSAHDCADGGLAVALAESCLAGGIGFNGNFSINSGWDAALFGEAQSRIVVSLAPDDLAAVEKLASEQDVPWVQLGSVGRATFSLPPLIDAPLDQLEAAWKGGLEKALG